MQAITQNKDSSADLLLLPTCKGIEVIDISHVIRIEAISNYSKLYFSNDKTLVVAKVLRWFEIVLPARMFIRTHRTHLVNRNFIQQYVIGKRYKVKLQNGEYIDVSKRKEKMFPEKLEYDSSLRFTIKTPYFIYFLWQASCAIGFSISIHHIIGPQ